MDARQSRLVPELDVSDLDTSLAFYGVLGFAVLYTRGEERFAYLERDGVNLMIEEAGGPGRRFRTAPLAHPFGRGVNFQIEVSDVDIVLERVVAAGHAPLIPIEERWYRTARGLAGNRQFVVADPDGYLLRFFQDLGVRPDQVSPSNLPPPMALGDLE
ncbi:MAG: bleomycin resistance protein [Candidatus Dormibacteria bacterium]